MTCCASLVTVVAGSTEELVSDRLESCVDVVGIVTDGNIVVGAAVVVGICKPAGGCCAPLPTVMTELPPSLGLCSSENVICDCLSQSFTLSEALAIALLVPATGEMDLLCDRFTSPSSCMSLVLGDPAIIVLQLFLTTKYALLSCLVLL